MTRVLAAAVFSACALGCATGPEALAVTIAASCLELERRSLAAAASREQWERARDEIRPACDVLLYHAGAPVE